MTPLPLYLPLATPPTAVIIVPGRGARLYYLKPPNLANCPDRGGGWSWAGLREALPGLERICNWCGPLGKKKGGKVCFIFESRWETPPLSPFFPARPHFLPLSSWVLQVCLTCNPRTGRLPVDPPWGPHARKQQLIGCHRLRWRTEAVIVIEHPDQTDRSVRFLSVNRQSVSV